MSKRVVIGAAVSVILLAVFVVGIATVDWDDYTANDQPEGLPTLPSDTHEDVDIWDDEGNLKDNSLAYSVFEHYGIVLIPLAILMFGAMIGGVCIAREEVENDDSN